MPLTQWRRLVGACDWQEVVLFFCDQTDRRRSVGLRARSRGAFCQPSGEGLRLCSGSSELIWMKLQDESWFSRLKVDKVNFLTGAWWDGSDVMNFILLVNKIFSMTQTCLLSPFLYKPNCDVAFPVYQWICWKKNSFPLFFLFEKRLKIIFQQLKVMMLPDVLFLSKMFTSLYLC